MASHVLRSLETARLVRLCSVPIRIDPESPVFPYVQVADQLRRGIGAGEIGPVVPSIMELTEETGLSRRHDPACSAHPEGRRPDLHGSGARDLRAPLGRGMACRGMVLRGSVRLCAALAAQTPTWGGTPERSERGQTPRSEGTRKHPRPAGDLGCPAALLQRLQRIPSARPRVRQEVPVDLDGNSDVPVPGPDYAAASVIGTPAARSVETNRCRRWCSVNFAGSPDWPTDFLNRRLKVW